MSLPGFTDYPIMLHKPADNIWKRYLALSQPNMFLYLLQSSFVTVMCGHALVQVSL